MGTFFQFLDVVNFGYNGWFWAIFLNGSLRFSNIKQSLFHFGLTFFFLLKCHIFDWKKYKKTKLWNRKNNDCFISPKRKTAIEKSCSKSSIISKVDHQKSRNWKKVLSLLWKLPTYLVCGSWQEFGKKSLHSKHVL